MANKAPTFDPAKIQHFDKMFDDAVEYAKNVGLPVVVVEARLRDTLSQLEAMRLLNGLRQHGGKI